MQDPMYLWLQPSPLRGHACPIECGPTHPQCCGRPISPQDVFPLDYLVDYVRIYEWM